jgi:hypothetical protein
MLSELQEVARSLGAVGLVPPKVHDWVKPQEKGDFLIASLGTDGQAAEVELRTWDAGSRLFKVQKDNQNSFPALKLEAPLWDVPTGDPARESLKKADLPAEERAAILDRLCSMADPRISGAHGRRLKARLQEFARELQPLFLRNRDEAPAVCLLIERVLSANLDVVLFLKQIRDGVIAEIRKGRETRKRIGEALLIGNVDKKASRVKEEKVTLVLDVVRRFEDDFERVAHAGMEAVYHRVLSQQPETGGNEGTCALTGTEQTIETGTFPTVKFPVIENTPLFSMNEDAGCHDRYGLIGSSICPVGKRTLDDIYRSAVWITSEERRDKTWRGVPASRGDKSDLLISYIEQSADANVELARLLAEAGENEREAVFESNAASLVEALNAKGAVTRDWTCRVLVLHRISKGQVQVEIDRRYKVRRIREGLEEWRAGAANTPPISIKLPGKTKGAPAVPYIPRSLFPGEVLRATKTLWIRGGTEAQAITGCGLGRVYDLLLGEGQVREEAAKELLRVMLERVGTLLARFGSGADISAPGRRAAVDACTVVATCLYKLGERKEEFMQDHAFLLGRFLSLADVLHRQYCVVKRDNEVPPQLLGNQHVATAALNPAGALSMLSDRLRIYKAWADTDGSGKAGLAKWALSRMAEVSDGLKGRLPERALTDAEKAEMLLGYLVREAKTEGDESDGKGDTE